MVRNRSLALSAVDPRRGEGPIASHRMVAWGSFLGRADHDVNRDFID
jgi:hypothetical protein